MCSEVVSKKSLHVDEDWGTVMCKCPHDDDNGRFLSCLGASFPGCQYVLGQQEKRLDSVSPDGKCSVPCLLVLENEPDELKNYKV